MPIGQRPASYMLWKITRMFSTRTNQKENVARISQKQYTIVPPAISATPKLSASTRPVRAPIRISATASTIPPCTTSTSRQIRTSLILTSTCASSGLVSVKSSVP